MHEFEQMEDAALAALAPLKNEGVRDLDIYVGQFEVEKLEDLQARFACVYVSAGEIKMPDGPASRPRLGFTLLVGDQNRRSARAAVRGDGSGPGVYAILKRSRDLLHQKKLISGWRTFQLEAERPLVYLPKQRICLFEALYFTEI